MASRSVSIPLLCGVEVIAMRLRAVVDVKVVNDEVVPVYSSPSWCCQKCGETIGWLGRLFELCFGKLHKCE